MKKFIFNTGVRVYDHNPPVPIMPGQELSSNGVKVIPFYCEDVPDNAIFKYASDSETLADDYPNVIRREIHHSVLNSKYAYFIIP